VRSTASIGGFAGVNWTTSDASTPTRGTINEEPEPDHVTVP